MVTMTPGTARFAGFRREALRFLADLAENNNREWFSARKSEYEELLKRPLEALCVALEGQFRALDIPLHADVRTSPFRIHRDTRFSRDKSPYRTTLAASFTSPQDSDQMAQRHRYGGVGGHFSLGPGGARVGGGRWQPDARTLEGWRTLVVERNAELHAAIDAPDFVGTFGALQGARYARVPAGAPREHPDAELLKLRQVLFTRDLPVEDALSPDLPDRIADTLVRAVPLMRLLADLTASEGQRDAAGT